MNIKVWKCIDCEENPCILPVFDEGDRPDNCPYSGCAGIFIPVEIEDIELIKYFTTLGEHYSLTPICDLRNGICPKDCDGFCEGEDGKGCSEKKRINRSLN